MEAVTDSRGGLKATPRLWPSNVRPGEWGKVPKIVVNQIEAAAKANRWPVLITGDVGVGKSTVAALCYRDWSGLTAKYMTASSAASTLKKAEFGGVVLPGALDSIGDVALLRSWCERTGLLVLDDLTNGLSHEGAKAALWRIIDGRAGRPAVYTANGSPDELAAFFGLSLKDRLFHGTSILWPGKSKRTGTITVVK